jgi:hypothetical protein
MRGISVLAGLALLGAAPGASGSVTISNATTHDMTCSGGVCAPTAATAILNASDLESLLESGSVTVTTTGSGVQADNIILADGVTWTSANTLALEAYRSIAIINPVSVDGNGGLNLVTNNGGTGPGSLTFGKKGHVVFSSLTSILAINGADYTLVGDIKTLASDIASNPSGNFALAADYDASKDGTYSTSPIGTTLSGNFEGLGNAISNLSLDDSTFEYIGLFAALEGGRISDIGVINADIASSNGSHGSGYAVGALLGYANGAVGGSYSSGTVSGVTSAVGGLIGIVGPAGSVDHSGSSASIAIANGSAAIAAGLVGQNNGMITHAYATGLISGAGEGGVFAGLVSRNDGTIDTSFASGTIEGGMYAGCGGLVGWNRQGSNIENSYATGSLNCNDTGGSAGGFAFENSATIQQCYSTGSESAPDAAGFVAFRNDGGPMRKDYWDTTSSGTNIGVYEGSPAGVTGLTAEQLQAGLPAGFSPKIWAENPKINGGLPYLIANPPPK